MTVLAWIVLAACAVAVFTDLTTRRIPNYLTLGLALVVFALRFAEGWSMAVISVAIFAAIMVFGLLAFSMGWLGGGDVKLAAAAAAAFGFPDAVQFVIYMSLGGGALALIFSAVRGKLPQVLDSVGAMLRPLAYKGTVAIAPTQSLRLPYGVAIAFGALSVALSHTVAPFLRLPL
jgi:prepilin peptidase CpaA